MNLNELQRAYLKISTDDYDNVTTITIQVVLDKRWKNHLKLNGIKSPADVFHIFLDEGDGELDLYYDEIRLFPCSDGHQIYLIPISLLLKILKSYNLTEYKNILPFYVPEHSKHLIGYHLNWYHTMIDRIERMIMEIT